MKSETRFILDVLCCLGLWVLHVNCKTVCTRTSNKTVQALLTCSKNQMIHVVSEEVEHADNSSTSCRILYQSCNALRTSSRDGLVVNCNGHFSCYEVMLTYISHCPAGISDKAAVIEYECIEGSVDICSGHSVTDRGTLYLHSPGFPVKHKTITQCTCTVSGVDITVMLLNYNVATYGALGIYSGDSGGVVWPTETYITLAYNREILTHYSGGLRIYYDNKDDMDGSGIWIRITGAKTISCTNPALSSTSTTAQTVTPVNTSPRVDKTDSTTVDRTSSTETTSLKTYKTSTSPGQTTTYREDINVKTSTESIIFTTSEFQEKLSSNTARTVSGQTNNFTTQLVIALVCAGVLIMLLITAVFLLAIKFHRFRKTCPPVELKHGSGDQIQTDSPDRIPGGDSQVPVDHTGVYVDVEDVSHVYSGLDARDGNTYTSLRVNGATTDSV